MITSLDAKLRTIPLGEASCCLCGQFAGDRERDLLHRILGGSYVRRVRPDFGTFGVVPSVGALVEGHLLLCPRTHVSSFAGLAESDRRAAEAALEEVEGLVRRVWRRPVHLFEHGNAPDSALIACSVDHAHLHVVPADADPLPHTEGMVSWEPVDDPAALLERCQGVEYLRYRRPTGEWLLAVPQRDVIPSQLMRRAFASALRIDSSWNWRTAPRVEVLGRTWAALAGGC